MEKEPTEEQRKQRREDLVAMDRIWVQFITDALNDVLDKGKCDMSAEVTVKINLKLTKTNPTETNEKKD